MNQNNVLDIISEFQIVIDCADNALTKYIINDACATLKIPLIYGTVVGWEGYLSILNYK